MKTIFTILFFLTSASNALANTPGEVQVGEHLREAKLQSILGKSKRFSDYHGKPLIINIWASWCGPCREEMASIQQLSQRFGGKKFNVIGISTDDDIHAAAALIKQSKLTFDNYIDSNLFLENMLGANTIPLTLLIDANGLVVMKIRGARNWNSTESIMMIHKTLNIKH